jgi:acyl phosphate:glycerol-3-phosphate acyltransferase
MQTALAIVFAYLLGSISFAVLVSKLMGLPDPHTYGSKNPGATNVLRTGSKVAALLTLIGDSCKGAVAVLLAIAFVTTVPVELALVGLAAFLGHLYPVFHRFQGGKGVATAGGIMLALHWPLGLGLVVVWATMAFGFRISSLASLTAAMLLPLGAFYVFGNTPTAWAMVPISALLFWRHRANIRQLLEGKERTIGG